MDDNSARSRIGILTAAAVGAALLAGCVATVRVAGPPPPAPTIYYPPAPPVEAPPAAVAEVQVPEPPPPLPDYDQPPCPEEGYIWTPGYWGFGPGGYYWVPGTWVAPPRVGLLWTPGYWGLVGAVYVFHAGYWGPHVGFYGGVNYGFGYTGAGFGGGRWVGNTFAYNRTVTNVNVTIVHNTYNETVVNNITVNRVSYNGGREGVQAQPTTQERQWAGEAHVAPTPLQAQHVHEAAANPALFAKANGGHPGIAATPRPAAFVAPGVVSAHGAAPEQPRSFNSPAMETTRNSYHPTGGQPPQLPRQVLQNNASRPPQSNAAYVVPAAMTHPPANAPKPPPRPAAKPKGTQLKHDQQEDRRQ